MKNIEFKLPQGWIKVSLSELLADLRNGTTAKQNKDGLGIPVSRIESVQNGKIDRNRLGYIENIEGLDRFLYEDGDIAFSHINSLEHVGKVALIKESELPLLAGMNLLRLRPCIGIEAEWLYFSLSSPPIRDTVRKKVKKAVNQVSINQKELNSIELYLPPSNEQKRIANKIVSLQAKSKKAKQALETAKPLLDKLRQSILASAFRGELTADWRKKNPDIEPAPVLLERIRAERRKKWEENELAKMRAKGKEPKNDKWKSKYKEPAPVDHSELYELPSGWMWSKMEDVSKIASNLVDPLLHSSSPHIAPDNIEKYTGKLIEYNTIQEDGVKSAKNKFFSGQIVYSKIRPYLSKCIIAHFDGLCSADMYPIDSYIDTSYLYYYILSNTFLHHIQKEAGNRVVLPKANQKQVYAVPVPIPPLSEQIQIAIKIKKMMIKKELVEKNVTQSTEKIQKIDQSILTKAFQGELVPQDPSEEPASKTIGRIKT